MKAISKLVVASFLFFSCMGQNSNNNMTIEPKSFSEKSKALPDSQILDVRTPEEFEAGHIDNAVNINWFDLNFISKVEKLDKTKAVFVYCKSGGRSQKAAEKLEELGFKTIYNLKGGILKWDADGFSKPLSTVVGLTFQEYTKLLDSSKKTLVVFYAEWCAPCKKMTPYLLEMQKNRTADLVIVRLNADENSSLTKQMKISELPKLLLYENKEIQWSHSGFISETDLKNKLKQSN